MIFFLKFNVFFIAHELIFTEELNLLHHKIPKAKISILIS